MINNSMTDKENPYTDLDIKHFKLASGDEVIGLIAGLKKTMGVLYLEHPVRVEAGMESFLMADYMPTAKDNIVAFSMTHVVAQSDVTESVKEAYINFCLKSAEYQYDVEPYSDDWTEDEYDEDLDQLATHQPKTKVYH